jgi:hypothetical protein
MKAPITVLLLITSCLFIAGIFFIFTNLNIESTSNIPKILIGVSLIACSLQLTLMFRIVKHIRFNKNTIPLVALCILNISLIVIYSLSPFKHPDMWRWICSIAIMSIGIAIVLNYKKKSNALIFVKINNFVTLVFFFLLALTPLIQLPKNQVEPIIWASLLIVGISNFIKNIILIKS